MTSPQDEPPAIPVPPHVRIAESLEPLLQRVAERLELDEGQLVSRAGTVLPDGALALLERRPYSGAQEPNALVVANLVGERLEIEVFFDNNAATNWYADLEENRCPI